MSETIGLQFTMPSAADNFDVFVDLSRCGFDCGRLANHLSQFQRLSGLVVERRRVTIAAPNDCVDDFPGFSVPRSSPGEALGNALLTAAAARRGLVVIKGPWIPTNEYIALLTLYQNSDPLIGTVQPRFASENDDRIIGLPSVQPGRHVTLPRAALSFLPETVITPELPAPLVLISPLAVLASDAIGAGSFDAEFAVLLVRLRRRGFRNLVCNRAVAVCPLDVATVYQFPVITEEGANHRWHQDAACGRAWLDSLPERTLEAILAEAIDSRGRLRVAFDCRGMAAIHNGTSHAMLGFLDGIARLGASDFEITVVASSAAARFHELEDRYGQFQIQLDCLEGGFMVAVRLNQPWDINTIVDMHGHAVFIVFNMLDTIAWDIIYAASEGLDRTWRLLPRLADAFLFNSNYTRERFAFRFKVDSSIPQVVTYHSLAISELVSGPVGPSPFDEPFILIFGNTYDHKGVEQAIKTLGDAFPYTRIVAIGGDAQSSSTVTTLQSGLLSDAAIKSVQGNAAAVVYPSYYEGFGLPVAQCLAMGRTVVVRRSTLWDEIAGLADLPGVMIQFEDDIDLIEAVGRALHEVPLPLQKVGGAVSTARWSPTWSDCSERIIDLIGNLAFEHDGRRWLERHELLTLSAPATGS